MYDDFLLSIGFPPVWEVALPMIIDSMAKVPVEEPWRHSFAITDPSGVGVSIFEYGPDVAEETFTIEGAGRVPAALWQIRPGLAGASIGRKGRPPLAVLLVMVGEPHRIPLPSKNPAADPAPGYVYSEQVCLGAIGIDLKVFPEEQVSAPFVTCQGVSELASGQAAPCDVDSTATINAVCESVDLVHNQVTGLPFYRVEAKCPVPITVALPADTQPPPRPGSILSGKVVLTATLTD